MQNLKRSISLRMAYFNVNLRSGRALRKEPSNARSIQSGENLAQPLTVDFVARNAGVSRRSLEMKFKETLGRSPYAEITRLRMERASNLLLDSELRIYQIGERCGYPEQHQFSSAFKRFWKSSPKAFRESGCSMGSTRLTTVELRTEHRTLNTQRPTLK